LNKHYKWPLAAVLLLLVRVSAAQAPGHSNDSITLAAGGDLIGPVHRMNTAEDPELTAVAELFRRADVGFANQENSTFDLREFTGYPSAENGGGYPLRWAAHAGDIKDLGISLVSVANNHATDFGPEGLAQTLKNLSAAGVIAGGAGLSDVSAREPVYLKTGRGLVALVATASTFPPAAVAGPAIDRQGTRSKPRPGISALHVRNVRLLPPAQLATLRQAAGPFATLEDKAAIRISDQVFEPGRNAGTRWEMDPADEGAILAAVSSASARADLVLFAIHAHETAGNVDQPPPIPYEPAVLHKANEASSPNDPHPASFEVQLFHAAIDHGADVVIRTGPHVISGIEIYKGKPIFYGLASLFLDFGGERVLDTPEGETIVVPDSWFETFVPVCEFVSHRLRAIKIYPITIEPRAGIRSGSPSIAHGERARAILMRLKKLSAEFNTDVTISGDVGAIAIHAADGAGST
jgi:poly-gamma-glutamate capsule biosynthesis protein CapA/YwtB (metallophosphatase superfamily)